MIDISTLAIHFPDMLDSQGNKIFASLSENGKGGDICERVGTVFYEHGRIMIDGWEFSESVGGHVSLKVIGILKGTLTAVPLCFPGVIFGSLESIRAASASSSSCGPLFRIAPILPSLLIINCVFTLPCNPIS